MSFDTLLGVVGAVVVAVVTGWVSYRVARQNRDASEASTRAAPYEVLARRVSDLESADETKGAAIGALRRQMATVIEDRDQLVDYVRQWWQWWQAGAPPPPPPVPTHLWDVIPPTVWQTQPAPPDSD